MSAVLAAFVSHRYTRWAVAFLAGLLISLYSFQRISDPEPRQQRAREEAAVQAARPILRGYVAPAGELQLVDPLAPDRKVGKVYIYPVASGWEISGHYRRDSQDRWHPYLMQIGGDASLISLSVQDADPRLLDLSTRDPRFTAVP